MWKILAMSALALGLSTPATALIVNETTDFADSLSLTTSIGVLDSGANTVTGEMNGSCDAGGAFCFGGPDRQDGFKFGVAAGHQLTGVFVGTEGSGPTDFTVTAQVWTPSVSMLDSIVLAVNDSGTMPAFAPLSAGTYIFNINGHTFTDPGSFGVVWSARFDVDQINAPATLALLSLGIAGLAYSQRKQVKVV